MQLKGYDKPGAWLQYYCDEYECMICRIIYRFPHYFELFAVLSLIFMHVYAFL